MFTIDVGSRDGWTGSVDRVDGGRPLDWPSEGAVGFASPDADEASGRDAWHKLAAASGGVWRLTIQPVVPHLEIHVRPPQLEKVSSERLVEALRDLALDLAADQRH
jgi:hypothetical protein